MYTRFFCTTRMFARCLRFVASISFFSRSLFFFACVSRMILLWSARLPQPAGWCTHSSVDMALNSIAWSEYLRRHAGHRPFRFCLMWCQQKRQICVC